MIFLLINEFLQYVIKYHQCLSRALTHVRSNVRTVLQNAVEAIEAKTATQKEIGDPTADEEIFTLYYGVFAAHSGTTKNLMESIEQRWDLNVEYENLLSDCHRFYFDHRQALVGSSVSATLQNFTKKFAKNSCGLLRNGCIFLHRVCEDEVTLFYRYFGRPSELMGDFLERLCMPIYDIARPIVVQVPHLEALAELCSILQV